MEKKILFDIIGYYIVKYDLLDDYIKFFQMLKDSYDKGHSIFKYKNLQFIPPKYPLIFKYLRILGIIEKANDGKRNIWKIVNISLLNELYDILEEYKKDGNKREKILKKFNNDYLINDMQSIMYKVGGMITKKEGGHIPDVLASIGIAYYVENYGMDNEIKKIIECLETLKQLDKIQMEVNHAN